MVTFSIASVVEASSDSGSASFMTWVASTEVGVVSGSGGTIVLAGAEGGGGAGDVLEQATRRQRAQDARTDAIVAPLRRNSVG